MQLASRASVQTMVRCVPVVALPVVAGIGAAALFAWSLLSRSDALLLPAYDTAFFQQVVWDLGFGHGFSSSFFPANFLGLHFEPLLAVPALLERLWPDARLLGVLQALALGAAAPAAYLLLDALLPGRRLLAAALAAPLPFWIVVQQAVHAGFHTEALALPLILLAGWAGLQGRTVACWALALVALGAKEDQAYAVAVIGALLFVHGPSRRQGAALAAFAVLWGAVVEWLVMPALLGGVVSMVEPYYHWLHAATPGQVLFALANPGGWLAFAGLVGGAAGLPLLRPAWFALALPPLVADLLSAHYPQPELQFHYGLPLLVPVVVAAGLGARSVPTWLPPAAVALPALVIGIVASPLWHESLPAAPVLDRLLACTSAVPSTAPVAVDDPVAAPLASRPDLHLLSEAGPRDYVVVDRAGREPSYVLPVRRDRVLASLPLQGRQVLCDDGRFQVWSPARG